ncbi:DUF2218 domain-containing protein [Microbulbifer sp. S227A]|uniref:DUF2218 domain-containing protein n=1 Tax=Microbulbifer sp. S227A TaxID=3415131 RepID=UPI003C7E1D9E
MLSSQGHFETSNGSKYLQQLCKHFAHKVAVEYDDRSGHADLPPGRATLVADDHGLKIVITAEDEKGLGVARYIVEDHLKRFAFREEFSAMNWTDA